MEYPHSYMGYQPLANWGISRSGCWVPYFSYFHTTVTDCYQEGTSSGQSHCSVTLKLCLLLPNTSNQSYLVVIPSNLASTHHQSPSLLLQPAKKMLGTLHPGQFAGHNLEKRDKSPTSEPWFYKETHWKYLLHLKKKILGLSWLGYVRIRIMKNPIPPHSH